MWYPICNPDSVGVFFPGDMPFSNQDGLTSTFQEKLFREHNTTKYNQMMYINLLSACVSAVTLMCTGHMLPAITFGIEHPRFFVDSAWVLPGFGILASSKVSWSPICREPRSQGTQLCMVTMIAPKTVCRFAVLSGEDHPPSQLDPNFCSSFCMFFLIWLLLSSWASARFFLGQLVNDPWPFCAFYLPPSSRWFRKLIA